MKGQLHQLLPRRPWQADPQGAAQPSPYLRDGRPKLALVIGRQVGGRHLARQPPSRHATRTLGKSRAPQRSFACLTQGWQATQVSGG